MAVKALGSSILQQQYQRRKMEYADRSAGTLRDGYSSGDSPALWAAAWRAGGARQEQICLWFRMWLNFLFGYAMLMRGGNRLALELPDLFLLPLDGEGPPGRSRVRHLVIVLRQGELFMRFTFVLVINFFLFVVRSAYRIGVLRSTLRSALLAFSAPPLPSFPLSRP